MPFLSTPCTRQSQHPPPPTCASPSMCQKMVCRRVCHDGPTPLYSSQLGIEKTLMLRLDYLYSYTSSISTFPTRTMLFIIFILPSPPCPLFIPEPYSLPVHQIYSLHLALPQVVIMVFSTSLEYNPICTMHVSPSLSPP